MPLDKIANQPDLDQTVTALDTALFDAYNHCDLQKFASLIADDVEFYHDKAGNTFGRAIGLASGPVRLVVSPFIPT